MKAHVLPRSGHVTTHVLIRSPLLLSHVFSLCLRFSGTFPCVPLTHNAIYIMKRHAPRLRIYLFSLLSFALPCAKPAMVATKLSVDGLLTCPHVPDHVPPRPAHRWSLGRSEPRLATALGLTRNAPNCSPERLIPFPSQR